MINMNKKKVPEIVLRSTISSIDDCALRASELIKEGYTIYQVDRTAGEISCGIHVVEPKINITLTLQEDNR